MARKKKTETAAQEAGETHNEAPAASAFDGYKYPKLWAGLQMAVADMGAIHEERVIRFAEAREDQKVAINLTAEIDFSELPPKVNVKFKCGSNTIIKDSRTFSLDDESQPPLLRTDDEQELAERARGLAPTGDEHGN